MQARAGVPGVLRACGCAWQQTTGRSDPDAQLVMTGNHIVGPGGTRRPHGWPRGWTAVEAHGKDLNKRDPAQEPWGAGGWGLMGHANDEIS
jgi:hypothetical protein